MRELIHDIVHLPHDQCSHYNCSIRGGRTSLTLVKLSISALEVFRHSLGHDTIAIDNNIIIVAGPFTA